MVVTAGGYFGLVNRDTEWAAAGTGVEFIEQVEFWRSDNCLLQDGVFDFSGGSGGAGHSGSWQWASRADFEAITTGLFPGGVFDQEYVGRVVNPGEVAGQKLVDLRHTGGKNTIENQGLPGGHIEIFK